ncbi:Hsp70 family protein [Periweissella ghanensis]|uniref:Chaperone protein DnaK n=1 Tax=Periweissella ghanensis TaxID=467997 RepID=A0ABM8ZAK5_9LACO|nr:Hsp70 family protein [Periweissella ghanensis]MCM0600561.1 Hsp70 family protein [Periweissella ghanensis]CAH0418356.1 Chaperone protein DnaK [Periweissella ghanensis]
MLIGIDFGTYDSGVAVYTQDGPKVILNSKKESVISSRVALGNHPLIGNQVPKYALTNRHVIKSIKRHLGEDNYRVLIDGVFYTATEVTALVLGELKHSAENSFGETIAEVVITVPVMFNDRQREAMEHAAKLAGFKTINLINETTAVGLAYASQKEFKVNELNIFCNIGAGMYDASLIEINNGIVEVIAANGSNQIGSDDFDKSIMTWLVQDFYQQHAIDLSNNSSIMKRLAIVVENAKIELSTKEATQIKVVAVVNDGDTSLDIDVTLTREHFNILVAPLVHEIKDLIAVLLKDSGYLVEEIDNIILAGGGSQVPVIKEAMSTIADVSVEVIDDEVMALKGTTIQSAILNNMFKDVTSVDVTPLSIILEHNNGSFVKLVKDNTVIPNIAPTIPIDKNRLTPLNLLQGSDNLQSLGSIQLTDIPLGELADECELEVSLDKNGLITVKVLNRTQDDEQLIFFKEHPSEITTFEQIGVDGKDNCLNVVSGSYHPSAHDAIEAAFDEGQFRYWDSNGALMQIEVPADQYALAVALMTERIKQGDIPTITDPTVAQHIIRKGLFSFDQVLHIALNGNVDAIKYNAKTDTIEAKKNMSISVAVAYVISQWYGTSIEKALLNATYLGLKINGLAFVRAILNAEAKRLGLNTSLFKNPEMLFNLLDQPENIEILKQTFGVNKLSPVAAELKYQIMKKLPDVDYIDMADIDILFKGRVNADILYREIKKTNERHVNITSSLEQFTLTDAEFVIKVLAEQFINLAREYLVLPREARQIITELISDTHGRLANALYTYTDPWEFCDQVLVPLFEEFAKHRASYSFSLEQLLTPLKTILADANTIAFEEF